MKKAKTVLEEKLEILKKYEERNEDKPKTNAEQLRDLMSKYVNAD